MAGITTEEWYKWRSAMANENGWTGKHYEQAIAERDELKRKVERCENLLTRMRLGLDAYAQLKLSNQVTKSFQMHYDALEAALNETEGGDDTRGVQV